MDQMQAAFVNSPRRHVLMLTTHGVHEWDVVPGLTDTGGQNVFVNQFAKELAQQGYKITIANRGGYPHPVKGKLQTGVVYKESFQRIIYLEDGLDQFVRKEDMGERTAPLSANLAMSLGEEKSHIDLIISHYWDAAVIGELFKETLEYSTPHVWVPHSLGLIKKRNVDESEWPSLRIEERIQYENRILSHVDRVATTSPVISKSLSDDYKYTRPLIWLPPCVSTERYSPHPVKKDATVWKILSQASGMPIREIQSMKIITEISRTDTTKRKDILLKAFEKILKRHPNTFLVITIDKNKDPIGTDLIRLVNKLGLQKNVAVLGSVWDLLPDIYAISDIYCTPSIMEGFGMSAQEAAATGVPIVSSSLVPFAAQYLYGTFSESNINQSALFSVGQGAIIVKPDVIEGFVLALELLLADDLRRKTMGKNAYQLTIPRFTWPKVVADFIQALEGDIND